jgi:SulP family sulfate permease
MWERTGFIEVLGRDHIYPDKRTAIHAIFEKLDRNICSTCHARVFWECQNLPTPLAARDDRS